MNCIYNHPNDVRPAVFFGSAANVLVTVVCLLLITACGRGGPDCTEGGRIDLSSIQLTFKTRNGDYLYPKQNPLPSYNIDSLRVSSADGRSIPQRKGLLTGPFATEYYVYAFGGIYDPNIDVSALSGEKCNDYFIRYNASDTDTLRLCYRVTEGECGLYFEATKAYYQNQLILHKQGAAPVIDIVK